MTATASRPTTLADALQGHPISYLLTTNGDKPPHAAPVRVRLQIDAAGPSRLLIDRLGRHSRANLQQQPACALLWPAADADGYSLMVDARAELSETGVQLTPTRAVLHRAAPLPAGLPQAGGCTSDCIELGF